MHCDYLLDGIMRTEYRLVEDECLVLDLLVSYQVHDMELNRTCSIEDCKKDIFLLLRDLFVACLEL